MIWGESRSGQVYTFDLRALYPPTIDFLTNYVERINRIHGW